MGVEAAAAVAAACCRLPRVDMRTMSRSEVSRSSAGAAEEGTTGASRLRPSERRRTHDTPCPCLKPRVHAMSTCVWTTGRGRTEVAPTLTRQLRADKWSTMRVSQGDKHF